MCEYFTGYTNWPTKAPNIYKGTQAQTRQRTFVKECCLQTPPKPLDTNKTNSFDKSASTLQGFVQLDGNTIIGIRRLAAKRSMLILVSL